MMNVIKFRHVVILVTVVAILLLLACTDESTVYQDQSLQLNEPVEIISWSMFADGGSIQITLRDSFGKTITFYYDKSMSIDWSKEVRHIYHYDQSRDWSKKCRHIYIGRMYEDAEVGKEVPIGSPVEQEIVKYVSKWMESRFPDFSRVDDENYMDSGGRIMTSGAISQLIEDLKKRRRKQHGEAD